MQQLIYILNKLPVIVPFDFFFMAWKHGVGSGLFEKTAFTTTLENENKERGRLAKDQGELIRYGILDTLAWGTLSPAGAQELRSWW